MMFTDSSAAAAASSASAALDRGLVALGLPLLERLAALALDLGVGGQDAAVGAGGQRRVLGLGEAVLADRP